MYEDSILEHEKIYCLHQDLRQPFASPQYCTISNDSGLRFSLHQEIQIKEITQKQIVLIKEITQN